MTRGITSISEGYNKYGVIGPEHFFESIKRILRPFIKKQKKSSNRVHVLDVFRVVDRTCILLSWDCKKHIHKVQIDLTMACEQERCISDWMKDEGKLQSSWLTNMAIDQEKVTLIVGLDGRMLFTSSVFEGPIHRYMRATEQNEAISLLRCAKMICKVALPELIFRSTTSEMGYHRLPYVNSYVLSRLIFQEYHLKGESGMCLTNIMDQLGQKFRLNEEWLDPITHEKLSAIPEDATNITHVDVVSVFKLASTNEHIDIDQGITTPESKEGAYFRIKNDIMTLGGYRVISVWNRPDVFTAYQIPDQCSFTSIPW